MKTRVMAIDSARPEAATLGDAARVLRAGGVVAFPTETFYGLGAAAFDARAVRRVFELKGRPASKPLLVLVDSIAMVDAVATDVPVAAHGLMARHWPGALTLVLRARPTLPEALTGRTGTVGVRLSGHPVARGLVAALAAPVTAPSANPTGLAPPATAEGVLAFFDGVIDAVLDGGLTPGGPPSTVLDVTVDPPQTIRLGAITP
jgi:L-threonylcarbamoyladenylate synthase